MDEPDRCSRCRREAVARQPYSGRALCAEHLVRDVEARAKRALRQHAGLRRGDRVGILAPGGPHGEALLAFAARQFGSRRDLERIVLAPGAAPSPPPGFITATIGDGGPVETASRLGCTLLLLPATLEERAAAVLGAVLAGRQAALAAPLSRGRLRLARPFEHVPDAELRLYLASVSGAPMEPAPPPPGDPFEALVTDELARHAARHPSAPFALVRLAGSVAELAAGEPGEC